MSAAALMESRIPGMTPRKGKVRDVYDFGERLLIVATDRISAFDWIMPTAIPGKGRVLTELSHFWFDLLQVPDHLISTDPAGLPLPAGTDVDALRGRSMVVTRTAVIPFECVVRGYLSGSGWKDYQRTGAVCGVSLPAGLLESSRLPEPIFTPATKVATGHDENVSVDVLRQSIGAHRTRQLEVLSLGIYQRALEWAAPRGIIIADTKFEFGLVGDNLILIDEVLTPDSSRFWPAADYAPGRGQSSYDKQYLRDWLEQSGWDKNSPPPTLPESVVSETGRKYHEAFQLLTGRPFKG